MERYTSLRNVAVADYMIVTGRLARLMDELEAYINGLETLLNRLSVSAGQSPEVAREPIFNRRAASALATQLKELKARFDEEASRVKV